MIIVSGTLGSRTIETLKSNQSRPTSSKVRAAIYDHLGSRFSHGSMLDVFAGTGAMSFEALSRGFDEATLIEQNPESMKMIKNNVETFKLETRVNLIQKDSLYCLKDLNQSYDFIFIDPPYQYKDLNQIIDQVASLEILKDKGYCIIETDRRQELKDEYPGLVRYKKKKYGNTIIHYYQKA